MTSLGSRHADREQILFHWLCVVPNFLSSQNTLADRLEEEPFCNTAKEQTALPVQHVCGPTVIGTLRLRVSPILYRVLCVPTLEPHM